jgi:bifunctional UDP-N-acetylglucosamine pyrophosphorylase/glucosamine-1-phosphate N-acetyltransferase
MAKPISNASRTAVAIMAAGKGTRLKSKLPKVLHEVGGKPQLAHVIAAAARVVAKKDIYVIIGHEAEKVREALDHTGVGFIEQEPQRGTGHALMVARKELQNYDQIIVLSGDAPFITPATIQKMDDFHRQQKAAMTILTAEVENPFGYGRIVRKSPKSPEVKAIVEQKALGVSQEKIREINSSIYTFDSKALYGNIDKLSNDNAHREYYLTDMAALFGKLKRRVVAIKADDPQEVLGSNTRAELVELDRFMRMATCRRLMNEGVTIFYPETCVIDNDVQVAADTVIEPFVQLLGHTKIGGDCRIRSYSVIRNSQVGDRVMVRYGSILDEATVADGALIGPYSHLRPGSEIGENAHVGNFVETKKIKLGKGSKANHLTYLGDAEIGSGVNIGAGTITCNYDGANKHKTIIGDNVFVGSDSTLVAPVKIEKGAYVAAGSCITDDVPEDALALGRSRQTTKPGWAKAKRTAKA